MGNKHEKNKTIDDIDFSKMDFNTPEMKRHQEIIRQDMENLKKDKKLYKKICKIKLDNEENTNKNYVFMLLMPLVLLIILIGLILYDNYATKRANDKLKKETYEYKQRLQKCQDERLKEIIGG